MSVIFPCFGQERVVELKGRVIDVKSAEPVEGVMVSVCSIQAQQDGSSGRVLGYSVTGTDGGFLISIRNCPDSLQITASSLMTRQVVKYIRTAEQPVVIRVEQEPQQLKEVKVIAQKLDQRGDTLDYNVASFTSATDRSVGDVLRKLPGLQVLDSGRILYQGKEISKFYIEGLDMLQGRYGIATNNIDASKVASIQVLERHQPIKVLRDSDIPETAAINLKLRRSSLGAFFVTIQGGIGLHPLLLSEELSGMRFTERQQNLLLYKYDNTGRDIARELTSFYGGDQSPVINVFHIDGMPESAIGRQHYLFNHAHLVSFNNLIAVGREFTLTTNLHYLHDRQERFAYSEKIVFLPGENPLSISENTSYSPLMRELSGTITLERNRDGDYLENRLDVDAKRNGANMEIGSAIPVNQQSWLPSLSVDDHFKLVNRHRSFHARVMYSQQQHCLTAGPTGFESSPYNTESSFTQQVLAKQFNATGQYQRNWAITRSWDFRMLGSSSFHYVDFRSELYESNAVPIADSLANDLRKSDFNANLTMESHYRKRPFSVMVGLPLNMRIIDLNDLQAGNRQAPVYFLPAPYGYVEFNRQSMTLRMNAKWETRLAGIHDVLSGYLMQSYRLFNRNEGIQPRTDKAEISMGVHYRDVSTARFISLMGGYGHLWHNTLANIVYSGIVSRTERRAFPNQGRQAWMSFSSSAELPSLHAAIDFQADYRFNQSVAVYQEQLTNYTLKQIKVRPSLSVTPAKWIDLRYDLLFQRSRTTLTGDSNEKRAIPPIHHFHQDLTLTLSPVKGLSLTMTGQHYYNNSVQDKLSVWFAAAGVRYKQSRVEFLLDWTNIFNTNKVVSYTYDDISSFYTCFTLRPTEILLRIKFSIL